MSKAPPITKPAPRGSARPECRACGERLKPNYRTVFETIEEREDYTHEYVSALRKHLERRSSWQLPQSRSDDRARLDSVQEDERGFYRTIKRSKAARREWTGTWGSIPVSSDDPPFCNFHCAARWAMVVCRQLDREQGRRLVLGARSEVSQ